MLRRGLSAAGDAKQAVRDLKRHVHRLYKHIHPDRLGRFPEHRAINEASFQVLQSALERHFDRVEARATNIPPQPFQRNQELTFFAQHPHREKDRGEEALQKAVVPFHESRLGNALHALFEALGLDPPPKEILPGHPASRRMRAAREFTLLTDLVKHARHVIMTNVKREHAETAGFARADSVQAGLDDEVVVTRLSLQRARGVSVVLGKGLPAKDKLVLLFRRLARTLAEARGAEVGNLVVELDGGFNVLLNTNGAYPWLVLGACAAEESWREGLVSEQVLLACQRSRRHLEQVQKAEAQTAQALGVKLVMHNIAFFDLGPPSTAFTSTSSVDKLDHMLHGSVALDTYVRALHDLRHATTVTQHALPNLRSLALMLERGSDVSSDTEQGVLRLGLEVPASALLETICRRGGSTSATFERKRAAREAEQKRVWQVKRALGIDGLRRGQEVSEREWSEALARMRADAGRLRGVLDGVPVVVGHKARILHESGEVEVPVEFFRRVKV